MLKDESLSTTLMDTITNSMSCVSLDEENERLTELIYTYKLYVDFDILCKLDLHMASDLGSELLLAEYYRKSSELVELMVARNMDASLVPYVDFINELRQLKFIGVLNLREIDDDDDELIPDLEFPFDLTEEGIEPNPGPVVCSTLRDNRLSKVIPHNVRELKKYADKCAPELRKIAMRAAKSGRKEVEVRAQIGAEYFQVDAPLVKPSVEKDPPKPDCPNCHKEHCNCFGKRLNIAASVASVIASLMKIIEAVRGGAQIGGFLTNALFSGVSEGTKDTVVQAIKETVNEALDAQMPYVPITVRGALQLCVAAAFLHALCGLGIVLVDVAKCLMSLLFGTADKSYAAVAQIGTAWFDVMPAKSEDATESIMRYIPLGVSVVLSGLVAFGVGKIPGRDNSPESWMRKIASFPRACSALGDISKYIQTIVNPLWSKFQVEILGYDRDMLTSAIPEIARWMESVEAYSFKAACDEMMKTKDGRFFIANLYNLGHQLMKKFQPALTPEYRSAMQRCLVMASKLKTHVETNFPEVKSVRTTPLGLWLVGESQIGKSRLQYLIATHLCAVAGIKDLKNQIYMRNTSQEFWDAYNGQFVCVFDDFGQQKDAVGNPNLEFMEIIRSIGPFPFPLHMADISEKSSARFTSGVVMCSTNNRFLKVESLTYDDAVWNRFPQSWIVELKDEFKITEVGPDGKVRTRLDIPKARAAQPGAEINPHIYTFKKFDARARLNRNAETGEVYEWEQFIEALEQDLKNRMKDGDALDGWLDEYASALCKEKGYAQIGTEDIMRVYAQAGTDPVVAPKYNLGEFLDWVCALTKNPIDGDDDRCSRYTIYAAFEKAEMRGDPYKTNLAGYKPMMMDEDVFRLLLIAFMREKDGFKSQVESRLKMCKAVCDDIYEKLPEVVRSVYTTVKGFVLGFMDGVCSFAKENKLLAALMIGVPALIAMMRRRTNENVAESDPRVLQPRSRPGVKAISKARIVRAGAELGQSMNQLNVIDIVRRGQYLVCADYDGIEGGELNLGCMTQIVGTVFMMPAHFLLYLRDRPPKTILFKHSTNDKIVIRRDYEGLFKNEIHVEHQISEDQVGGMDVVFFVIPEFMRAKDITKHFATEADLAKMAGRNVMGTLSGIDAGKNGVTFTTATGECKLLLNNHLDYVMEGEKKREVVSTSICQYRIPTKFGDCGKIVTLNTDAIQGRIVGIHVSGTVTGWNYAQVVSQETIMTVLADMPKMAQIGLSLESVYEGEGEPIDAGFIHLGRIKVPVTQSSKTCIGPSKLHNLISPATTKPAMLKPTMIDGVLHDPLIEGAKKAGIPCGLVPEDVLEQASKDVFLKISQKHSNSEPNRVLDYEEAIRGIPGDEYYQPINRTTSPGYPYMTETHKKGYRGKTKWMGKHDYDFESEEAMKLRSDTEELIEKCRNDEPFEVIWVDTLKDERRPIEKVKAGKTRVISNGPMHFNIAFRMYFMTALVNLRLGRIFNGIAVGLNVWSKEWDSLAGHLLSNSPLLLDGDFRLFDGTLIDKIMWKIFEILDAQYNDGNTRIRRNLWYHVVYAVRLCRDRVYQCTHSLPSGFVATAEVNSLYVNIIFRCAYLMLARLHKQAGDNMETFNKKVKLVAYGDDNIYSVSPDIISWFNMNTITAMMKQFGMDYTPADKSDDARPHKTITEVSFLKRYFRRVDTRSGLTPAYMCPADLESRLEMLNWTKSKGVDSSPEEAMVITDVLKELAMHGCRVYDDYAPKIVRHAIQANITGFVDEGPTYHQMKVITGHDVPRRCEPARSIQNSNAFKDLSNAIDGRGGSIYSYTLGSPVAAPHYPREHWCDAQPELASV
uniref:RNA-dependent RNA polymerase n=1 Tax=Riboviria sp. TaxID=2585031 RepID=A0A6M9Z7R5_9VIRU|nr:MAG: polymerase polyprotein [Dicistroviridae sp.]QKN89001.1 MAG: RNA-dependent RNA polymerase [Riboviria sp.]